ncbi:PrpR N-terminal domain-containing protein [Fusobacterium nucleatum]|uniref:PrpR N-terminal domain-containing protein n=1 Tax=Fusobacterium vincentii TaxID=155615 RepID=UPI0004086295|nr:PrpR N-terminal domain-containing protein [Fusobacterium vincentii]ALF20149.1 transcriptional regulator [Fusobacterium vincentii ChDC F8]PIH02193.1 transcriptional regulator [Fusobacterium vincentii]QYR57312.1 PrpR N-terminal domain-containing protein [Fusobacterium vincentii]
MSKIAFLVSGEKMFKKIKKYMDKKNIIVVEITISNALEEAKKLVDKGVKVILTKLAIKMKIEDEIEIPILNIENNISDYIELLKEIDVKNNKIAFVDYIEAPESLVNLAKIISDDIVFRTFTSEKECDEIVNDLKNKSYSILIGSILTKKYANKYGLKSYEVEISKDSILMYIEIAEQIIKFIDIKKSRDRILKSIEIMIDNYLKNEEKTERNILHKVSMNDVEKNKLIEGLKRNAFSLSNTAKDLGMSRTTLWRKLKKFNIIIE